MDDFRESGDFEELRTERGSLRLPFIAKLGIQRMLKFKRAIPMRES